MSDQQAALYRARRNHKLNALVGTLTPWSHDLTVTAGQFVQSFGQAYQATSSGTTGTIAPSGVKPLKISDGAVYWIFTNNKALLQYLGTTPPTPEP